MRNQLFLKHLIPSFLITKKFVQFFCYFVIFQKWPYFYTPWKYQKTSGFMLFLGGIEIRPINIFEALKIVETCKKIGPNFPYNWTTK